MEYYSVMKRKKGKKKTDTYKKDESQNMMSERSPT